jgi:hypothetical protein
LAEKADVEPELVRMTKTERIIQMLAEGKDYKEICLAAKCATALVYKVKKAHADDIAALKDPVKDAKAGAAPVARAPVPPALALPVIDPARPAAPQLEPLAWLVIAKAASGGDVTAKAANAAKEIIKQAARDKVPPPVDRKLVFKLDVIDVVDGAFKPVGQTTYEIKP